MSSPFFKNIATLSLGAGIGQIVPLIFLPLLTRVYGPESFGVLALYVALISVLGVIASGRYEQAIMLPKDEHDALVLCQVAIMISLTLAGAVLIVVICAGQTIAVLIGNPAIYPWLYFLPVSIVAAGIIQTFTVWHNRKMKFKTTATVRVIQSTSQSLSQLLLGLFTLLGLIMGQIIGAISASLALLTKINKKDRLALQTISNTKCIRLMREYSRFPKYGAFGAVSNALATQMPIFIITGLFEASITGYFSLTFRVLTIPASLLSTALSQVFYQKVAASYYEQPETIAPLVLKTALVLFGLFSPVILVMTLFGTELFIYFFGHDWKLAGEISEILVFAAGIRFIVSPLSVVLSLGENLKKGVTWQFIYLLTITSTLLVFSSDDIKQLILALVIHDLILYSIYFILIYYSATSISNNKHNRT